MNEYLVANSLQSAVNLVLKRSMDQSRCISGGGSITFVTWTNDFAICRFYGDRQVLHVA